MTLNSMAMHYAHSVYDPNEPLLNKWSYCVRFGWQVAHFRQRLTTEVLRFNYIKIGGIFRLAYGTLRPDLIPAEKRPKGITRPQFKTITYYDLDCQEWRSFRTIALLTATVYPCHPVWVADEEE